jgi:predicted transcriptional regulator
MIRMTFTFDEHTVDRLQRTAARVNKSRSAVVREAILDYADRVGRLSEEERRRMLAVLDRMAARPAGRSQRDVDAEIADLRRARRTGGRRTRRK